MKKSQAGISLVELVIVAGAVVFLGLLVMSFPSSVASISRSRHISIAKDIANRQVEELRKQTYGNLANGTNSFTDTNLSSLNQGTAAYEVSDCPVTVCTDGQTTNIKQVKVTVSWDESGDTKKVEMDTLVGEGGVGQ